ncbi:MAG: hypothetical protein KGZ49_12695 [Syntrophaceae bacterium]|nr:hypothetical protein [Syntrophaceae bacterium]
MPKQVRHDTLVEVKKRIGIKYCGGCNPSYERVEIVRRVQSQLNDRFFFLSYDRPDIDVMILLSGCQRTCAAQDLNRTISHYSVAGENEFEALMGWLKSLTAKRDS